MIADVDARAAPDEVLAPNNLVTDKIKLAEDPRPQRQKPVPYPSRPLAKQKWQNYARQQDDHEYREHQEDPDLIEGEEYAAKYFQFNAI